MSLGHDVCLANEHAECRRSPESNKIRDAAAEGAKSRMEQSETKILGGNSRIVRSVQCSFGYYSIAASHLGLIQAFCLRLIHQHATRAWSPRAGGGGRHTCIADHLDEDDSEDQLNPETVLSTLTASDQPILQQIGAFLKAKDETILALQQQLKTSENNRLTQEAIRNYEDGGRSGFHFHL